MKKLSHEFVEYMPEVLRPDVLYISPRFNLITHLCCCGCGEEVVLKLSPTDWRYIYDGETVTIRPSVGNWGFKCRSHYVVTDSKVQWADSWSEREIRAAREYDLKRKEAFAQGERLPENPPQPGVKKKRGWFDYFQH